MVSAFRSFWQATAVSLVLGALPGRAAAQPVDRFEAAASVAAASTSEFEGTEVGVGGRFGWRPFPSLGFESEMTYYPGDYPDPFPISSARWEGFFGATLGPRFGRFRVFARVRPGFLSYREASEPFACIAIYPPPLVCTVGAGLTVFAMDLGGGVEANVSDRGFVRVDVGDRALRFEGPVFDVDRRLAVDSFWSHGPRLAVGGGVRF